MDIKKYVLLKFKDAQNFSYLYPNKKKKLLGMFSSLTSKKNLNTFLSPNWIVFNIRESWSN